MTGSLARVLCVDDDADGLERLRTLLSARGYEVCTARSAAEAIALAKRWTPRLTIVAPRMARSEGTALLEGVGRINPGMTALVLDAPLDPGRVERTLAEAGVEPAPPRTDTEAEPEVTSSGARHRVLVVDDEADVREVLVEYLGLRGFEAIPAASGEEALALAPLVKPRLILLDLSMPGLGGLETLRRLQGLPAQAAVVIVSANDAVEVGQRTLALGAVGYVPKPVDFDYLDAVLQAAVEATRCGPRAS